MSCVGTTKRLEETRIEDTPRVITHVAHPTYSASSGILVVSHKAKYARLRTLYGLAFAPHTHSHSGGSGALRTTRPTVSSVEKPAISDAMTGISFQSVLFSSFHCLVVAHFYLHGQSQRQHLLFDIVSKTWTAFKRGRID